MKKFFALFIVCLTLIGTKVKAEEFDAAANHALAVELTTGKILYEKNADSLQSVTSLNKLLTIYMVYKEIAAGRLSWQSSVDISDYAYALTTDYSISNVPLDARKYTVEELVKVTLIANANSPAIALAEHIGGSESKFVDMMQAQLQEWGITDAKLINASGLPNSYLGDNIYPGSSKKSKNKLSAYDLAIISYHLVKDFPEVLKITSSQSTDFEGYTLYNDNYMLKDLLYQRSGVDGLLLGTSKTAGDSFITTSTENSMKVLTVILGASGAESNSYASFDAANGLLNYIQTNFKLSTVLKKGKTYQNSSIKVIDGQENQVASVAKNDFKVVKSKSSSSKLSLKVNFNSKALVAPVAAGQTVGTASFEDPALIGQGYLEQKPSIELITKTSVNRDFFLTVWWNHFVNYVNENL